MQMYMIITLCSLHICTVCGDIDLAVSDEDMLPNDSFTYVSEAHHTVSWLHHCLSTADAHQSIENIVIKYDLAKTDHIHVCVTLDVNNIPILTSQTNNFFNEHLNWSSLTKNDLDNYCLHTEQILKTINVPNEAALCRNVNCKCESQINNVYSMYNDIVDLLKVAGEPLKKVSNNGHKGYQDGMTMLQSYIKLQEKPFCCRQILGLPNKAQHLN